MERKFSNPVSFSSSMKKMLLTAMISLSIGFAANAAGNIPDDKLRDATVTSLGVSDGAMTFNLKYANPNSDKLKIVLSDKSGTVLYKEIMNAEAINKTFKTTSDVGSVVLTILNLNDKTTQKFEISNEKKYTEEVLITNIP
jgi:hypothetical protein